MVCDPEDVRLTPFEQYMLADERTGFPMRLCFRFEFSKPLDESCLSYAFLRAKDDHPMLRARIHRQGQRWSWAAPVTKKTSNTSEPDICGDTDFELTCEMGIRYVVNPKDQGCEVWLLVHHSRTDGQGAIAFVSSWFAHYSRQQTPGSEQENAEQENFATDGLCRRDIGRHRSLWKYLFPVGKLWGRLWAFYAHRPEPIRGPRQSGQAEGPGSRSPKNGNQQLSYVTARLPFDETLWGQQRENIRSDVTINDMLLVTFFQTICEWNSRDGREAHRDWIRLTVPMNLGTDDDRNSLVANFVSMVFVDRRLGDCRSFDSLLTGVNREMRWIKQHGIGYGMLDILRILARVPGGIRTGVKTLDFAKCATTSVVSNLGRFESLFPVNGPVCLREAKLEEVDFIVPFRPGTAASFGVLTYQNEFHISMNYDCLRFSRCDAQFILDSACSILSTNLYGTGGGK